MEIARLYIKCCIAAVLFGIFEMSAGTTFWGSAGLSKYASVKGNSAYLKAGLFRSFFSYDFFRLKLRRMASFLVDPVILGQLFAFGFLLSFFCKGLYSNRRNQILGTCFIGAGLLLTFAKGGIVIAAVAFCILMGRVKNKKILSDFLLGIVTIGLFAFTIHSIINDLSGNTHIEGLITGFRSMLQHPLGLGIGSAGNMADAYSKFGYQVAGDESYVGSLMAQTGILGVVLNILFWKMFLGKEAHTVSGDYVTVLKIANLALLLTSFINYTAISFSSCFIFILLAASGYHLKKEEARISFSLQVE